jgi:hypothetical protein
MTSGFLCPFRSNGRTVLLTTTASIVFAWLFSADDFRVLVGEDEVFPSQLESRLIGNDELTL